MAFQLGAEIDPNKRVLLFANGPDWPSDDPDDITYTPSRQYVHKPKDTETTPPVESDIKETKIKKKKKKKKSKYEDCDVYSIKQNPVVGASCTKLTLQVKERKPKKKKKVSFDGETKLSEENGSSDDGLDAWGRLIPPEILLKIFQCVVKNVGAVPFLFRAASVCSLWKETSLSPCLWQRVDLSGDHVKSKTIEDKLVWMCENRLGQVVDLNLSGWGTNLNLRGIEAVTDNCPKLSSLSIAWCNKISSREIQLIADKCENLHTIILSGLFPGGTGVDSPVSHNSIKYVALKCGKKLKHISLSNNVLKPFLAIVKCIADHCPNLRVLDLSNVNASSTDVPGINIEKLQTACPKLQVLRLTNTMAKLAPVPLREQVGSPGFPELEELSVGMHRANTYFSGINGSDLDRILKKSEKLKLLDIRSCKYITSSFLVRLPAWDVEHLLMSLCTDAMDPELELVMQKWQHSLIDVDLSWNVRNGEAIDSALNALGNDCERSKLQVLNVCGSSVSFDPVKHVLKNCPHLRVLNLSSCRSLPRGIKRSYQDEELDALRNSINSDRFAE